MMCLPKVIIDIGVRIVGKLSNLGFEEHQAIYSKQRITKMLSILW